MERNAQSNSFSCFLFLQADSLCTDVPHPQEKSGEEIDVCESPSLIVFRYNPLPIFPEGGGTSVHRLQAESSWNSGGN